MSGLLVWGFQAFQYRHGPRNYFALLVWLYCNEKNALTTLVCLWFRVWDPCQDPHSIRTLMRGFWHSLSNSTLGIMPPGRETWPGRFRYVSKDRMIISSSASQIITCGVRPIIISILSLDHRSSTQRMDDLVNFRVIAAAMRTSWQAFMPDASVTAYSRKELNLPGTNRHPLQYTF